MVRYRPSRVTMGAVATDVEIRNRRNRLVERFSSNVDPADEEECIALLRRRAKLRIDLAELSLSVVVNRRWRTYRS
jgi:hypothetical protein